MVRFEPKAVRDKWFEVNEPTTRPKKDALEKTKVSFDTEHYFIISYCDLKIDWIDLKQSFIFFF